MPHHVHLAYAGGSGRPVVESPVASVLARGVGQGRDKGLQGAVVPLGITVMTHHSAAVVRIHQQSVEMGTTVAPSARIETP